MSFHAGLAIADSMVRFTPAQSRYLEGCGGCHGIDGTSAKTGIPQLRGSVGRFLCTAAGREYIVRLPNVAFADMDDELLAEVMNWVVFGLGGESAPVGARPYSAREVSILRRQPLKNEDLARLRKQILTDEVARCKQAGRNARAYATQREMSRAEAIDELADRLE